PSSQVSVDLEAFAAGRGVLSVYPRTGRPGRPVTDEWNAIPGARGCTPQACAFRDHAAELEELGAHVAGLSAQTLADQEEAAGRPPRPYRLIADAGLEVARPLPLPTFRFEGAELYKRLTLIFERGAISHVSYPVFPPDRNASDVVAWLRARL